MNLDAIVKLEPWKKKKLLFSFFIIVLAASTYLIVACHDLYLDKVSEEQYWIDALTPTVEAQTLLVEKGVNATEVIAGTYLENIKEISLKNCFFRFDSLIWFRWDGNPDLDMAKNFRIYKGNINKMELVKDYHENGTNYQLIRVDATVSKNYWTNRFPLESHQLRFYIEPSYTASEVILVADTENSGTNSSLSISGYDIVKHSVGTFANEYENSRNDPEITDKVITSELVTAIEINRNSWGLYAKCFIALLGTISWVMITLFLNTFHRVDPLGMIPAALFGTVSNIMVGANLIPDALYLGLLEYVNIYGILTILTVAITIININRIRNKWEDRDFAKLYGRVMFYTIFFFIITGNVVMPLIAYKM